MAVERTTEFERTSEALGVFEETARLRKVIMWGTPGIETALGQLLPKDISCFLTTFDVMQARDEYENAETALSDEGVQVISVKDLYVKMLMQEKVDPGMSLAELKSAVEQRVKLYYEIYRADKLAELEKANEGKGEGEKEKLADPEEILDCVDRILAEDMERYGDEKAVVALHKSLSLDHQYPLANLLYARDQSNLVGRVWVWSSMRHPIRQDEVSLYRSTLEYWNLLADVQTVQVSGDGRFEGGDAIVHDGICYIGVGGRTNMKGVVQVAPAILNQGMRLLVPFDEE